MILFKTTIEMTGWVHREQAAGRQIGFVPTMGALHAGHISLIGLSKQTAPLTVCSIFVNPTQFNDPKDFRKYPITIEKDIYQLEKAGVDVLFLPDAGDMYPGGTAGLEHYPLGRLETLLEGKFRPGHFQGVCQAVSRLLDRVQPHHLFMGQKDYQQCLVVRRLMDIKGSDTQLHTCPIVREADGLAMSSRNQRLEPGEREKATAIYRALSWLKMNWQKGEAVELTTHAVTMLEDAGLRVDYVAIADAEKLEPLQGAAEAGAGGGSTDAGGRSGKAVALAAAFLGEVRLIDNMFLEGEG